MGCSVSKVEPGEEAPAGLRPVRWRVEEIRRRRRVRKDSISAAELLRSGDLEAVEEEAAAEIGKSAAAAAAAAASEEERGRKLGSSAAEDSEELPGSPSFRFYFSEAVQDSDMDLAVAGFFKPDGKLDEGTKENSHGRGNNNESLASSEDSELKPMKKKGRKFKVLTRAPSAVYSLLNIRNCCTINNSIAAITVHENHRQIKAA